MELEMQMNTQKQIIDEKTQVRERRGTVHLWAQPITISFFSQESESLSRLLKDAETRIAEAEVRHNYMIEFHLFTSRKK